MKETSSDSGLFNSFRRRRDVRRATKMMMQLFKKEPVSNLEFDELRTGPQPEKPEPIDDAIIQELIDLSRSL